MDRRFLCLVLVLSFGTYCSGDLNALPNITMTEFNEGDNVPETEGEDGTVGTTTTVLNKPYNSDVVVGEDTKAGNSLLLSCIAPYPVQWVYTGDGRPELSTNTSIKFLHTAKKSAAPFDFTAFAYISSPREKNTGNYSCRSLQDPRISVYYFVYVPGMTLFTSSGDYAIPFNKQESTIRIPCSVSNPKAMVGLQKAVEGLLNCPLNESISYDPKTGFHLKTTDFPDPTGRYICTAAFNNTVRYIEFNLTDVNAKLPEDSISGTSCKGNKECDDDKACLDSECVDPCEDICGLNAKCRTLNHVPECYCPGNLVGDPYFLCRGKPGDSSVVAAPSTSEAPPVLAGNPCSRSKCGEHGQCSSNGKVLVCTCKPGYYGTPPHCTPKECSTKHDCPSNQACIQGTCSDPCITGVCGKNSNCRVVGGTPVCSCAPGFSGDPFDECKPAQQLEHLDSSTQKTQPESDPGHLSPCSAMTCGRNAGCTVLGDGRPICRCEDGYNRGDPYTACYTEAELNLNPCNSSPCGPNTICEDALNGTAICTCMPEMSGNPYRGCRRTNCISSNDCPKSQLCHNQKCLDGCTGLGRNVCGANAECRMEQHEARCYCGVGFTGNPEIYCHRVTRPDFDLPRNFTQDPCNPSPCGHNAECSVLDGRAICRCPSPMQGDPLKSCAMRCQRTSTCPQTQVCYAGNNTCVDPCLIYDTGCGEGAVCKVANHIPNCFCPFGFRGNPYKRCQKKTPAPDSLKDHETVPCYPLPCGANAVCVTDRQGRSSTCACKTGYYGDPFAGCQQGSPCNSDAECSDNTGCVNRRCLDLCKFRGSCGINQDCRVVKHRASCYCRPGYPIKAHGNCYREPEASPSNVNAPTPPPPYPESPTLPSTRPPSSTHVTHRPPPPPYRPEQQQNNCAACGPNSDCQVTRGVIVCSCKPGMIGSPPNCRPECQYDGQCSFERACISYKCQDPCVGACGQNALCRVRQRIPVCSCPKGYYGNPVYGCKCCDHNVERTSLQDDEYEDQELYDSTFSPPFMFIPIMNHTLHFTQ